MTLLSPGPGKSQPLRDDLPGHVHHHGLHTELPASRGLHQGGGRLDGDVRLLRVLLADGVRLRQLRRQGGPAEDQEGEGREGEGDRAGDD